MTMHGADYSCASALEMMVLQHLVAMETNFILYYKVVKLIYYRLAIVLQSLNSRKIAQCDPTQCDPAQLSFSWKAEPP